MFTKFFTQIYPNTIQYKTFFCSSKRSCVFSFKMKKYTFYRFHPMEITKADKRDCGGRNHSISNFPTFVFSNARSFLHFSGSLQGKNKEYQGKKLVGYSADQMFEVVADVEKYENFLPFCKKSHVFFKSSTFIKANLVIGFPPLVESYTSKVSLVKPQLIKAVCTEGRLFNYLLTTWKFSPGLKNNEKTCIIDFFVSFEFKSALHSHLANIFFNELVWQMESAFYQEAKRRYGKPVVKMQSLNVLQKNS